VLQATSWGKEALRRLPQQQAPLGVTIISTVKGHQASFEVAGSEFGVRSSASEKGVKGFYMDSRGMEGL